MLQVIGYVVLSGIVLAIMLDLFSLFFVERDFSGNDGGAYGTRFPGV